MFGVPLLLTSCGVHRPSSPATSTTPGTGASQHEIDLQWAASPSHVAGYHVYRASQHDGPYSLISPALVTGTTYTDSQVAAGDTFYYVVTAVDGNGAESDYSPEAQATVPTS
jgi:fibronectin type 3 domain-containing protein